MQDGGLQVMHVHGVILGIEAEVIRRAETRAGLNASPCHPDRVGLAVVVASVFFAIGTALGVRGPAEFTAPDDEGVIKHATLFEVLDERGGGLVDIASHFRQKVL